VLRAHTTKKPKFAVLEGGLHLDGVVQRVNMFLRLFVL
jgi:hypothetical protein